MIRNVVDDDRRLKEGDTPPKQDSPAPPPPRILTLGEGGLNSKGGLTLQNRPKKPIFFAARLRRAAKNLIFELFGAAGENFTHFYIILERFCSQKR